MDDNELVRLLRVLHDYSKSVIPAVLTTISDLIDRSEFRGGGLDMTNSWQTLQSP